VIALAALFSVSCGGGSETESRELINPDTSYAGASRFGDLIFTAGQLPENAALSGASFPAQVNEALDRLEETLEASGAGFDTLLKVNVYLTNWDNWDTFDTIYVQRIGPHGTPPRTTVEVRRLGFDAQIEIAAIAHVRSPSE
jgi:2-iminobutanoate/2-iminopropanoate deaminase